MTTIRRTRSAEWRVSYLQKRDHIAVYLGQWFIGTIRWTTTCALHKVPHYAGHLQLPGIVGPVTQTVDLHEAKIEVTSKVKEWTLGMNEYPTDHEEREEKAPVKILRRRRVQEDE